MGMATPMKTTKLRGYVRRSRRFPLHVPVVVYGRSNDNLPFRDKTHTLNVDAHGARLAIAAELERGQTILVVNSFTQEERECRVVHVGSKQSGKCKVGIEFVDSKGNFWHIYDAQVEAKLQPSGVV
jgi:hypothetical protein